MHAPEQMFIFVIKGNPGLLLEKYAVEIRFPWVLYIEFSGPDQFHRVFLSVLTGGYIRVRQSAARGALPERNDKLHPCSLPRSISIAFAR